MILLPLSYSSSSCASPSALQQAAASFCVRRAALANDTRFQLFKNNLASLDALEGAMRSEQAIVGAAAVRLALRGGAGSAQGYSPRLCGFFHVQVSDSRAAAMKHVLSAHNSPGLLGAVLSGAQGTGKSMVGGSCSRRTASSWADRPCTS